MPELKNDVKPVMVEYACDACSEKPLVRAHSSLDSPGIFVHECTNCGKQYDLDKSYPYIIFSKPLTTE